MKIAYNPTGGSALSKSQIDSLKNDIIFDLSGMAVYARGIPVGKVYLPFEKSTSSTTEGYNGLVPFPDYNGNSKTRFLREDGTWVVPTNNYRPISINGTPILENNNTALNLVAGTNITLNPKKDSNNKYTGEVTITASNHAWSNITGKPTTLAGYGITDAVKIATKSANVSESCVGYTTADHNLQNGGLFTGLGADGLYGSQLLGNYVGTGLYYRGKINGTWTNWKTVAFTDSNVASATKLETSRTIWGLSFDGTKNVQGALSGATTITTSGNITTGNSTTTSNLSHTVENNNGKIGIYVATRRGLYDYTIGNWLIGTDGTNTRLMIGNIGIGTDSPLYKLHVAGTTSTNLLFIGGSSHPMIIGNGSLLSLGAANSNSKASVVLDLNTDSFRRNSASTAISLGTAAYPWANIYGDTITIKNYKNFINGNISYPNVDDSYKMGTDLGLISFIGDNGNDTGLGITWSFNTTSAHAGIYTKLSGTYGSKMYFATTNAFSHGPKAALEIDHEGNIKALRGKFKGHLIGTISGSYTADGGQQNPNYFGKNKVGFLMMNTTVNNNSSCKDWIIMDCYAGSDVGGAVAFGVNRQSLGAYIMRSASERTFWTESAELLGTHNYNNYALSLSGGTLSGDLTLLNLYVNYMITSSKPSGALYNPWSIHMDNYLWIQSATADGTNVKGKIALSGKGAESLTELFLKADLTKIHNTILFNKLSVPTTSGGSTYGPGANGQVLKSNGSTVYWANANTYAIDVVSTLPISPDNNTIYFVI